MPSTLSEKLIKGSENAVSITLTENGTAISVSSTEIVISLFRPYDETRAVLTITRSPTGFGVAYTDGVITLTPADLSEDLGVLKNGRVYRAKITIKTATQTDGVVYGGNDSDAIIYFVVSALPA